MRALTLHPHWAHAVAHLDKRIENRTRPIPAALVGQRIAIHAGATLDEVRDYTLRTGELQVGPRWALELSEHWPTERIGPAVVQGADGVWRPIVCRAIVAVATLREPFVSAADWRADGARLDELPPWADPEADYWWELSDVVTIRVPVPVLRGQLGLWRLDDVTEAAVTAAGG